MFAFLPPQNKNSRRPVELRLDNFQNINSKTKIKGGQDNFEKCIYENI